MQGPSTKKRKKKRAISLVALALTLMLSIGVGFSSFMPTVRTSAAEADLQTLINSTPDGGTLVLPDGASYVCNCVITRPITITGNATIATANAGPAIEIRPFTHDVKLLGLEITALESAPLVYNIIQIGNWGTEQDTMDEVPFNITIDSCDVHGQPTLNSQRGILTNGANISITNSRVREIHWVGVEAQAIASYNGPGPFTIRNNYLEAAGINILFGGAQASIPGLVASDIEISGNYLFKPLKWRIDDPQYAGIPWTVKNLFELKNARRVLFTNNVLENSWAHSQTGWAVIFNAFRNEGESVEDIVVSNNLFRNVANGVNLRGSDSVSATDCGYVSIKRVTFVDNTFENVGAYNGEGKNFQLLNASEDVTFDHNTSDAPHDFMILQSCDAYRHVRLRVTNNLSNFGIYGIFGDGGYLGTNAFNRYAADYFVAGNALYGINGQSPSTYPEGNYFPATLEEARTLIGIDGYPVGARTSSGGPSPTPTPVPSPSPSPSATPTPTPTPEPSPSPTPTPVPVPPSVRTVAFPSGEAKQNAIVAQQWLERYRFKRHLSGNFAEFEYVP